MEFSIRAYSYDARINSIYAKLLPIITIRKIFPLLANRHILPKQRHVFQTTSDNDRKQPNSLQWQISIYRLDDGVYLQNALVVSGNDKFHILAHRHIV